MVDNFDLFRKYIEDYLNDSGHVGDNFFFIYVLKRKKDIPNENNFIYGLYFVDNLKSFDLIRKEIVPICKCVNGRAYITVNARSKMKLHNQMMFDLAKRSMNDCAPRSPWTIVDHCVEKVPPIDGTRWIIDIDTKNETIINKIIEFIKESDRKGTENLILLMVPTANGIHLVTKPFYRAQFEELCKNEDIEIPEIKKNHITLLYYDGTH